MWLKLGLTLGARILMNASLTNNPRERRYMTLNL
jgi:hypothetical protein